MNNKRMIFYIAYIIIGLVLVALGITEYLDSFWSGMGGALIAVGAIRLLQTFRYRKDKVYQENKKIELEDERNRFIRNKAWAWAGYMFVLITAISVIVFKVAGHDILSQAAGMAVCLLMVLYWISFMVLQKKY